MRLNWNGIRALDGEQSHGFEELCIQLARQETPDDAKFIAKGRQDAGVECFCVFPNGKEWGWQAKFFTAAMTPTQWRQLDHSVETALDKHPELVRYFVCVPHGPADPRIEGRTSELGQWNARVQKWQRWAQERGMDVEFIWRGSSELIERLSAEKNAGRLRFWFDDRYTFSHDWFAHRLEEAIAAADERYTPDVHVDLDVAQSLEIFGRTERAINRILSLSREVRNEFQLLRSSPHESHHVDEEFGLAELQGAGARIVEAINDLSLAPEGSPDIAGVVSMLDHATTLAEDSTDRLAVLEQRAEDTSKVPDDSVSRQPSGYRFQEWRTRLRLVAGQLRAARSTLLDAAPLLSKKVLILKGEAGAGKTHLLCAAAEHRRDAGMPTVLLMGQQFGHPGSAWPQLLDQLSLETMTSDQFVGALEAAAQTADCRALIMIDALNEGRGIEIWPDHLAPFLTRLTRSPWISVLISVRSTYLEELIPAQVREQAACVEHHGFLGNESEALKIYFDHYELELPSGPVLLPEFRRPLFLKSICEGLRDTGERRLPQGFHGISAVFDLYLDAVNRRVSRRTGHDPRENLIRQALERLAKRMHENRQHALSRREARGIVDALLPGRRFEKSLFQAMIAEGVLLQEANRSGPSPRQEQILITYERFSDHVIADYLLDAHFDIGDPAAAFSDSGGLAFVRTGKWWLGPMEALCVQLPERHGLELFSLVPEALEHPSAVRVFLGSLVWRATDAFSEDTHATLKALIDRPSGIPISNFFDALLTVATIPGHAFNSDYLDARLRRLEMPDRDARWSTYLHNVYGGESALDRILDWATSLRQEDVRQLDGDAVDLCGVALAWMLTSSNRFVRDRATKGLVALFSGRLGSLRELLERFHGVDDAYVAERLYAVAYGCATRCHDPEDLESLAAFVYRRVFADGTPPPHILLRDYARGVVERALRLGADIDVSAALIRPPYRSPWPNVPSADELARLAPWPDVSDIDRFDPRQAESDIHFSVMYGDFGRYIIGADLRRGPWLDRKLGDEPWRDPDELMAELEAEFSSPSLQAQDEYQTLRREHLFNSMFDPSAEPIDLPLLNAGGEPVESLPVAEVTAEEPTEDEGRDTSTERVERLRDAFLSGLSPAHRERYLALERARAERPYLDPALIQRYVLWRVFDLGWTIERFGRFDLFVNFHDSRESKKPERIGKKYQWIAYHEFLAYLSDHHQFDSGYADDPSRYRFNGPWQIRRRDIDPTAATDLPTSTASGEDRGSEWWRGYEFGQWRPDLATREWLDLTLDEREMVQLLRVTDPKDGATWLNLRALRSWRDPSWMGSDDEPEDRRQVWIHANAYLVDAERADAFYQWARQVNFMGRWMPEPGYETEVFLGEHGWSPADLDRQRVGPGTVVQTRSGTPECPTSVYLTAFEYLNESGDYDCSLQTSHKFVVPERMLIDGMDLRWGGGDSDFFDANGNLAAFASDPSGSTTSLLVREDLIRYLLDREGLALVWTVLGEKELIGGRGARRWTGSLQFTGAYHFNPAGNEGSEIDGGLRFDWQFPEEGGNSRER